MIVFIESSGSSTNQYNQAVSNAAPSTTASTTARHSLLQPVPPPSQAHAYIESGLDTQSQLHQDFRSANSGRGSDRMPSRNSSTSEDLGPVSGSPSANTMAAQGIIGHELDESMADGRKAKRALSQSKRAAQNRAAQVSSAISYLLVLILVLL